MDSRTKMTDEQATECLFIYLGNLLNYTQISQNQLAVTYGVSQGTVNRRMKFAAGLVMMEAGPSLMKTGEVDNKITNRHQVDSNLIKLAVLYYIHQITFQYGNLRSMIDKYQLVDFAKEIMFTGARRYGIV